MAEYRALRFWGFMLIGSVGGICIIFVPLLALGRAELHSSLNAARIIAGTAAAALSMIWALFFATRAHRSQDEFQRQRAESSWYWGSSVGLGVSVPFFFFIGVGGLHWIDPAIPSSAQLMRAFLIGYMLAVLSMTLGFFVARYWPRHAGG
jgi:hypothetical protein